MSAGKATLLYTVTDLNLREVAALAPIAALCLFLGLYPQPDLERAKRKIDALVVIVVARFERAGVRWLKK